MGLNELLSFLKRRQDDADLDEEIRYHLDAETRDRIDAGMTAEEAGFSARRAFGNVARVKEVTRQMRGWASIERLWQDTHYALRTLRRSPGFAITAVLSLALGIGANTASFSLADAFLFRPMPVHEPSAVVTIAGSTPQNAFENVSYPDYLDLREQSRSFDGMVAYRLTPLALSRPTDTVPQMRMGMQVSAGFFDVLGVEPAIGRAFTGEETTVRGRDAVAILSYDFWRRQFGADPSAIGGTVMLNGIPFTIVGVAPESFTGMDQFIRPAFYVPLTMSDRLSPSPAGSLLDRRGDRAFLVKGRLKPGVRIEQAQAELAGLARGLGQAYPETDSGRTLAVHTELQARMQQSPRNLVLVSMLLALSGLVLAIACANVASLLLARARSRSREFAIRLAIGAGRARLLQQLLTESVILALCGGIAAVGLAQAAIRFLASIQLPTDTPIVLSVQLDHRVLVFSLAVSIVSAVLFGLAPAWKTVRPDLAPALKSGDPGAGGRVRNIGRNVLVAGQVALSLVLLVTSATLFDAFRKMLILDPGIRTDHIMMAELDPALVRYTPDQTREFYRQLVERTRALAGVRSATLSRAIPFRPNFTEEAVAPVGYQIPGNQRTVIVSSNVVDEQYFQTMGTPILRGRGFTVDDRAGSRRVAVVNEEYGKRYWPGQDPIGKRFHLGADGPAIEVVGVARTGRYLSLAETAQPYFYLPLAQNPRSRMTLLVETEGEAGAITGALLQVVRSLDTNQPVYNVRAMREYYERGVLGIALVPLQMVGTTGLVGLALALVGLYGLISYSVSRRTREIGIRMAVGADGREVLKLILRQGLVLSLAGVLSGLAMSVPVFRLLASGLAGLGTLSPWTLAIVPAGLILVAMCACYIPGRRASRIDPTRALRQE